MDWCYTKYLNERLSFHKKCWQHEVETRTKQQIQIFEWLSDKCLLTRKTELMNLKKIHIVKDSLKHVDLLNLCLLSKLSIQHEIRVSSDLKTISQKIQFMVFEKKAIQNQKYELVKINEQYLVSQFQDKDKINKILVVQNQFLFV